MSTVMTHELDREDLAALNAYLVRGLNFRQVYDETGISRGRLRRLLERDDVRTIINNLQTEFQQELDAMQEIVLNKLRDHISNPKAEISLAAIDKWMRANGKFKDNINVNKNLTAEDVAKKLMETGDAGQSE